MRIRKSQMEALSRSVRKRFEDRVVAHLHECFPDDCLAMGEQAVREMVQAGIARAEGYGLSAEYDVVRYVDLMVVRGRDFDTSPRTPWAAPILRDPDLHPTTKMDRLYEQAEKAEDAAGD